MAKRDSWFTEYRSALWKQWRVLLTGVLAFFVAGIGAIFDVTPWLTLVGIVVVTLVIAQALAWRDVRREREAATEKGTVAVAGAEAERDAARNQVRELQEQIRKRDEREDVRLRFVEPTPEQIGGGVKLVTQVWNDGATSDFSAHIVSVVEGVVPSDYGLHNRVAWEGELGPTITITKGGMKFLYLCDFAYQQGRLQLIGPASSYTRGERQTPGRPLAITGRPISFLLEVRDVKVDVPVYRRVEIELAEESNFPRHRSEPADPP